jgi:hypothetical protein
VSDEVWASDLSPHELSCVVRVTSGTLTIGPGVEVKTAPTSGLRVSESGGATLRVLGSEEAPVVFEPPTDAERGHWQGIFLGDPVDLPSPELRWLTLDRTGSKDGVHLAAGLFIEAPDLVVEEVHVTNCEGYGFLLASKGSFSEDSTGMHVTGSAVSGFAEVWATGSIPTGDLTGNDIDAIDLPGGTVTSSARWEAKNVAYRLINDAYVDGTDENPVVLTLGPGTTLRFGDGRGLYIALSGPAALVVEGTEDAPVVFRGDRNVAASWAGVGIRSHDTGSNLAYFELAYAGTSFPLDGALHLEDAAATVDHGYLHDNAECAIWLEDGTTSLGDDLTYANNAEGNLCQPE